MDSTTDTKKRSDLLFILWAGGAALLSYALVYALRKPFTAAGFDGLEFLGMDYKTAASIIQIAGYVLSKLLGIKFISELKHECRLRFIIGSVAAAECSLLLFAVLPGRSTSSPSSSTVSRWDACGASSSVFSKGAG